MPKILRSLSLGLIFVSVYIILEVFNLFLDLQGFLKLRQMISQLMTLIKPWQVACALLRLYWSAGHSHEGKRVNVLIYPVLSVFYDNGGAHTGCEEPHQSQVAGRLWFISLFSEEFQDPIPLLQWNKEMFSVSSTNESLQQLFFLEVAHRYPHMHTLPMCKLSLARGVLFILLADIRISILWDINMRKNLELFRVSFVWTDWKQTFLSSHFKHFLS